jgi:glycosyltransferase involved in cell wall biosynthesis
MTVRISVVTAVLDRASTLGECLASVAGQRHADLEHVLVDGVSTDGSLELIQAAAARDARVRFTSERDRGLYDAVNKGVQRAQGDVVAILGADDVYADDGVLTDVAACFERTGCDACYGDLLYVDQRDPSIVRRRWIAGRGAFRLGWMPPHPTFFVRRSAYERLGVYDTSFRIAADYELMLRFVERHGLRLEYVPRVLVRMRTGGTSNRARNLLRKSLEDVRAWRVNGLRGGAVVVALKNLRKAPQLLRR